LKRCALAVFKSSICFVSAASWRLAAAESSTFETTDETDWISEAVVAGFTEGTEGAEGKEGEEGTDTVTAGGTTSEGAEEIEGVEGREGAAAGATWLTTLSTQLPMAEKEFMRSAASELTTVVTESKTVFRLGSPPFKSEARNPKSETVEGPGTAGDSLEVKTPLTQSPIVESESF